MVFNLPTPFFHYWFPGYVMGDLKLLMKEIKTQLSTFKCIHVIATSYAPGVFKAFMVAFSSITYIIVQEQKKRLR